MYKGRSITVHIYTDESDLKDSNEHLLSSQVISVQYFESVKKWIVKYYDSNAQRTQITCDQVVTVAKKTG